MLTAEEFAAKVGETLLRRAEEAAERYERLVSELKPARIITFRAEGAFLAQLWIFDGYAFLVEADRERRALNIHRIRDSEPMGDAASAKLAHYLTRYHSGI